MQPLASYTVSYRGGLPGLPKAKAGGISFKVCADHFELAAKRGAKFWPDLAIPYARVTDVTMADRKVSTFEVIAGGVNSHQLNQRNNIHISFTTDDGVDVVLRLEMLSGVAVPAQAKRDAPSWKICCASTRH